jgi:hypothetical protein
MKLFINLAVLAIVILSMFSHTFLGLTEDGHLFATIISVALAFMLLQKGVWNERKFQHAGDLEPAMWLIPIVLGTGMIIHYSDDPIPDIHGLLLFVQSAVCVHVGYYIVKLFRR